MNGRLLSKRALYLAGIFLLLILVPYLYAASAGGDEFIFGGFLLNPIDGNSYLAKMYQGWTGEWQFRLPYTPDPGEGAYLFLFYLFLGHLARILGLTLPVTFHLARILAAVLLLVSLYRFYHQGLGQSGDLAFLLAIFGSGLGWLATVFELFTADFWVAEAYPFLSAYANPHFPLALSLMLFALTNLADDQRRSGRVQEFLFILTGFLLALILPFGIVLVLFLLFGLWLWDMVGRISRREPLNLFSSAPEIIRRGLALAMGGAPVTLYYLWAVTDHPQLAVWNAQNLTPSPPWWDVLISFSPALPVALLGGWLAWRAGEGSQRASIIWLVLGLVLLALPVGLQRRFILGYYIPLTGLAAYAVDRILSGQSLKKRIVVAGLLLLMIPTNLVILLTAWFGIQTHDEQIYLYRREAQAFAWVRKATEQDALIMAAPESGLLIPAYTGRQVIYGHPFETVGAEKRKELVQAFYEGEMTLEQLGLSDRVDYLFYGPRERELGSPYLQDRWSIAWETGGLKIYRVQP